MVTIRRSVKYPESTDSYRIGQRPRVRVSIADYGVGNLHSIRKALELAGARPVVESNIDAAMRKLDGYRDIVLDRLNAGTPCLGICIGAQILFEGSEEGEMPGLGLIKGRVVQLPAKRVPHMGWNEVRSDDRMFENVPSPYFYFAHSYCARPEEDATRGTTDYEGEFPSVFRKKNVLGVQFHPEKSSASGAAFLRNYVKYLEEKL